jgi:TolA-binding protein
MAAMNSSQPSPYQMSHQMSPPTTSPAAAHPPMAVGGGKRKVDPLTDPSSAQALEEATRMAAEEDKRRRNTAASARFRVKKKQREAALEKQAKEMTEKVSDLEKKVNQLETENKWLKGLITEKNENRSDVHELYKKYTMDSNEPRSTGGRTDGVGTEAKDAKVSRA